jgi:hypothetical protein
MLNAVFLAFSSFFRFLLMHSLKVTFALACETPSKYCIEYSNGTLHDVWTFEFIALLSVVAAIGGYLRASHLHRSSVSNAHISASEGHEDGNEDHLLRRNDDGVST